MNFRKGFAAPAALLLASVLTLEGQGTANPIPERSAETSSSQWVGSWAASQQLVAAQKLLLPNLPGDATLRQIVPISVGGTRLRVHLSNAFGGSPLRLASVHIAKPVASNSAAIDPVSDKALTFAGRLDVTIPAGAEYLSDPIDFPAAPLSELAVSIHYDQLAALQTGHPGSRATSYLVSGDAVASPDLPEATKVDQWFQISAVDVRREGASVVVLGDSITDGHGATTNGNDRWTDVLARRLQANSGTRNVGVLNQGIGGNHLLTDGIGQNALARFDRDVLAQTGARWVIVLEGVNDLGEFTRLSDPANAEHELFVKQILGAYEQIITRAHAAHLKVIGATIMPYTGSDYYHPPASNEVDRQAVNAWIRRSGHFDAVVDFDKGMADPLRPDHLAPAYDSGDHLHPSPAGYKAMGEMIPLLLFAK